MSVEIEGLELGTVLSLTPIYVRRLADVEVPLARGVSKQALGMEKTVYELDGVFTGSGRFSSLKQLQRFLLMDSSFRMASDLTDTVVWLKSLRPRISPGGVRYTLTLEESRFMPLNRCESLSGFSDANGTLSLKGSDPTPVEGSYCLRDALPSGSGVSLIYAPSSEADLTGFDYTAFSAMLSGLGFSHCYFILEDRNGYTATVDFGGSMTASGVWKRVIVRKSQFDTGIYAFEWDHVEKFKWTVDDDSGISLIIDDLGAYE